MNTHYNLDDRCAVLVDVTTDEPWNHSGRVIFMRDGTKVEWPISKLRAALKCFDANGLSLESAPD